MKSTVTPPLALLASLLILTLSHGLMVVLSPVHLRASGVDTQAIGWILSMYSVGVLLGGLYNHVLLQRAGHIRTFACTAALIAVSILACSLSAHPVVWACMRLLNGFAFCVGLAVIDNWLSVSATQETRGQLLAANQMVITGGMFIGQFLFNIASPLESTLFVIGGMLAALSLVPMVMSRSVGPVVTEGQNMGILRLFRKSPLGMVSCFFAGLLIWSMLGMLPIVGADMGLQGVQLTLLTGSAILGSFVVQYPVGFLSDRYDRRTVMTGFVALAVVVCALVPIASGIHLWLLFAAVALSAGVFNSLYALGVSQTFDHLRQSDMGAALGGLLVVYAVGAIIGPFASAYVVERYSGDALFYFCSASLACMLLFTLFRIYRREALPAEDQEMLVASAALGGAGGELDPRTEYNLSDQALSEAAELTVFLASTKPNAAITMGVALAKSNPSELLPLAYALAEVEGVESKTLMRQMSVVDPDSRTALAEAIAMAWPAGATDIVEWLLDDDTDGANEAIAGMAQAVPEVGVEILEAAIEQLSDDDGVAGEAVQELADNYMESVSDHYDQLRPADRAEDNSEEHVAEAYTVFAEAMPEQSVDIAQSFTEAAPTAATEVTEAFVQVVSAEHDNYGEEASEVISEHMSNMTEAVPEQLEDIAASIVEVLPEAAEDVEEAVREWQQDIYDDQI